MTHVYEQPLYLYEAGSRLTGTSIATSDSDMIEVRGEPIESLLGIGPEMKATQIKRDGADVAIQPLRKFVSLLAQGNPNMVQGLFVPEDLIYECHPSFRFWIKNDPDQFISQKAGARFKGYAWQQFETIIAKRPARVQRPELVEEHGYDTKFAGHAYRLTMQGVEYLTEGRLTLPMPERERQTVLDIRAGKYSKDEVTELIRDALAALDVAHERSPLPEAPDYDKINANMISLFRSLYPVKLRQQVPLGYAPAPYLRY